MKGESCDYEILNECNSGLFEEDDVGKEKECADGERKVGIDGLFVGPELACEELRSPLAYVCEVELEG